MIAEATNYYAVVSKLPEDAEVIIHGATWEEYEELLNRATQDRYSTARVSKRLTHRSAACLRARYCTSVPMLLGLI